jgi:subtilisin family serine protease
VRAGNNDDAIGHGTHVLGVILGTGTLPLTDTAGFTYGLGVAPGAKAVVHNDISLNSLLTSFPNGFTAQYTQAVREGAIVSNNSWGPSSTPQGYDANTREFDMIARDADPGIDGDQSLALSWSIMNGRGGVSSQGAPTTCAPAPRTARTSTAAGSSTSSHPARASCRPVRPRVRCAAPAPVAAS